MSTSAMDESISEKTKKSANAAADAIKEKLQEFKEAPSADEIRALAKDLAEDTAAFVRKYPLQSLAGAMAAGFLLSSFLNRKRD